MRRRILLASACAILAAPRLARAGDEVDLLLVLAADVSQSMQHADLVMQRRGYVAALRDRDVWRAVGSGSCGSIGLLYLEWSGVREQQVLVPWTRLAHAEDAEAFAARLEAAPLNTGTQTSISGAIAAARRAFATAPFVAPRMVVDISGDGENNHGGPAAEERDAAVAEGVTLNGLPVLRQGPLLASVGSDNPSPLEQHYRDQVIGGMGAFVLPANGFESFGTAIRRKLVLEIAGRPADTRVG